MGYAKSRPAQRRPVSYPKNSSTTIRTPKSRNTTIGTESLPIRKKNRNRDRRRTAARNRPFPMFFAIFPTSANHVQFIGNLCPFQFGFDDRPSARARPPPQHVAGGGAGRGRTGNNRKVRCGVVSLTKSEFLSFHPVFGMKFPPKFVPALRGLLRYFRVPSFRPERAFPESARIPRMRESPFKSGGVALEYARGEPALPALIGSRAPGEFRQPSRSDFLFDFQMRESFFDKRL